MSEARTESTTPIIIELKGDSRLIVLLGSPEGIKIVSKRLTAISDFTRIRRGLFIAHSFSNSHTELLQTFSSISFIRTREIPAIKPRNDDIFAERAFSIVSYIFNSPNSGQKKKVERLIRKSICIRLRPSVLLFPMLRSKERRRLLEKENGYTLLDSRNFVTQLDAIGVTSMRWSRIKLVTPSDSIRISEAIERTLKKDMHSLETKIQDLREASKNPEIKTSRLKRKFSLLTRRYKKLKIKWLTTKPIWSYDTTKPLKRTYNMLLTLRRTLENRE